MEVETMRALQALFRQLARLAMLCAWDDLSSAQQFSLKLNSSRSLTLHMLWLGDVVIFVRGLDDVLLDVREAGFEIKSEAEADRSQCQSFVSWAATQRS